ncbi:MAG: peptidylprolyl isomerase [Gammaproteobacteria bacterium]
MNRALSRTVCTLLVLFGLNTYAATDNKNPPAVLIQTSQGNITVELNPDKAPITVENFLRYVKSGHYEGTIFHRVIKHFMIQGGGYSSNFQKIPTRSPIINEADNGLKNSRGTIAMARTPDPHSATAQFFINVVDNHGLDHRSKTSPDNWGYAVFGKVISGIDVVDKIRNIPTGSGGPFRSDLPRTRVVIEKISVIPDSAQD